MEEFTVEFRGKIRAQFPESVQSLDVKSIKSLHATKWKKIIKSNEMKAFVNLRTCSTVKDTFINNRRAE